MIIIWPYEQMVLAQPRIHPKKWDAWNSLGFWDTNGSFNFSQTTRPSISQKKKKERKDWRDTAE